MYASSHVFFFLLFSDHCTPNRFLHMDRPNQLRPFVVDFVLLVEQQSTDWRLAASIRILIVHRDPVLVSEHRRFKIIENEFVISFMKLVSSEKITLPLSFLVEFLCLMQLVVFQFDSNQCHLVEK